MLERLLTLLPPRLLLLVLFLLLALTCDRAAAQIGLNTADLRDGADIAQDSVRAAKQLRDDPLAGSASLADMPDGLNVKRTPDGLKEKVAAVAGDLGQMPDVEEIAKNAGEETDHPLPLGDTRAVGQPDSMPDGLKATNSIGMLRSDGGRMQLTVALTPDPQ